MSKEFIPYQESLELKELGFNYEVEFYKDSSEEIFDMRTPNDAPCILWQQAFRWFREKYDITQTIARDGSLAKEGRWAYTIIADLIYFNDGYFTYEEAELECLIKLIEILKNK